jgi:hypothetical protein
MRQNDLAEMINGVYEADVIHRRSRDAPAGGHLATSRLPAEDQHHAAAPGHRYGS